MEYPFVSIVVGIRNEEQYIAECIESLLEQDYPKDKYETIIVDGMSTDKSQDIVKQYPVKLLLNEKMNVAAARNLGVKEAKGDFIAFTDGDCKADKHWLKTLVNEIKNAGKDVACVGGPNLIFDDDPTFAKVVGYAQETFLGSGGSAQANNSSKKKYVQSLPNCNALYKKSIIENIGYFDEHFVIGQDGDLNHRISKEGYRFLYIPEAKVWHHRRGNIKIFSARMFKYGKWMAELFKKHRDLVRWYAFIPPIAIIFSLISIIMSIINPVLLNMLLYIIAIYTLIIIFTSFQVIYKMNSLYGIWGVLILPTQHFMYGAGIIANILNTT
jgi:cellulose synthase/poly-beta-1,6-N-acetylglucosamine synthase-like glycosyltransferase